MTDPEIRYSSDSSDGEDVKKDLLLESITPQGPINVIDPANTQEIKPNIVPIPKRGTPPPPPPVPITCKLLDDFNGDDFKDDIKERFDYDDIINGDEALTFTKLNDFEEALIQIKHEALNRKGKVMDNRPG